VVGSLIRRDWKGRCVSQLVLSGLGAGK